jgi:hypothetical protein
MPMLGGADAGGAQLLGALAGGPFHWRSPGDLSNCGLAYETELRGCDQFDREQRQPAHRPTDGQLRVPGRRWPVYVLCQPSWFERPVVLPKG